MKNVLRSILFTLLIHPAISYSQTGEDADVEYLKSNIALTKFKILGVNSKQYAKCVESENLQDASRKLKSIAIDKITFLDDGRNYDIVANDGILTSTAVFDYEGTPLKPGTYQDAKENYYVIDESFKHAESLKADWPPRITITVNLVWKKCKEMEGFDKIYCERLGWPWGWFVVKDVKIGFEL